MTGYFGSKAASGLEQTIIAMMPPHDTSIETHLGGGAVMRKKPPARNNIAIAIDPDPLAAFDCGYYVQQVNDCASRYLRDDDYAGSGLIYCDPPALLETRPAPRRDRYESSRQDPVDLLARLKSRPCRVILSGYPSALYAGLLAAWHGVALQAMTWGGPRTEKLWYNYDMDPVPWATYAERTRERTSPTASASNAKPNGGPGMTRGSPLLSGSPCWPPSWRGKRGKRSHAVPAPAGHGYGHPGPDKAGVEKRPKATRSAMILEQREETRSRLEEKDQRSTELSDHLANMHGEFDKETARPTITAITQHGTQPTSKNPQWDKDGNPKPAPTGPKNPRKKRAGCGNLRKSALTADETHFPPLASCPCCG